MSAYWADRTTSIDGHAFQGTGSFRMMPNDEYASGPAGSVLTAAAGGHALVVRYTWFHPSDGPQDGVLLVGSPTDDSTVTAAWLDGWHQNPGPMVLTGREGGGVTRLEAAYMGTWGWQIELDLSDTAAMRIVMRNVIPDEAVAEAPAGTDVEAGPYDVMDLRLAQSA